MTVLYWADYVQWDIWVAKIVHTDIMLHRPHITDNWRGTVFHRLKSVQCEVGIILYQTLITHFYTKFDILKK